MSEGPASYQTILAQARRLPRRARQQLAETLLRPAEADEQIVFVSMRRLQPEAQARFLQLMDGQNAGELKPKERAELNELVARYETLMLANSETLLAANHPALFTSAGRLRLTELRRTARQKSLTHKNRQTK
jgi:hypothetical protein